MVSPHRAVNIPQSNTITSPYFCLSIIQQSWNISKFDKDFLLHPAKSNMQLTNDGFQKESPFAGADSQV